VHDHINFYRRPQFVHPWFRHCLNKIGIIKFALVKMAISKSCSRCLFITDYSNQTTFVTGYICNRPCLQQTTFATEHICNRRQTTFAADHVCSRPRLQQTMFAADHVCSRPRLQQITFATDHVCINRPHFQQTNAHNRPHRQPTCMGTVVGNKIKIY